MRMGLILAMASALLGAMSMLAASRRSKHGVEFSLVLTDEPGLR